MLHTWIDNNRTSAALADWIFDQIQGCTLSNENKADINKKIKSLNNYVSSKVQKCVRNMRTFRVNRCKALSKSFKIVFNNQEAISNFKIGRPRLTYAEADARQIF